jgi:hypothetical protein
MWNDKPDGYGYEFLPTGMSTGTNFYPQPLYWRAGNCSTRSEPDPLPSLAPSSATTVPAPPSTTTAKRCPTAPPTHHQLGEPRRRSSCPAPPQDPTGARRQHIATGQPPPHRRQARHRADVRASCVQWPHRERARRAPRFHASQAASSAGLGRQAVAQLAFWPTARGRPPGRASQAVCRFEARQRFLSFFNYFKL